MMRRVHVIGAGLAGLAAALRLSRDGASVRLYEAAPQAGGRCRSYFDPQLDAMIDNGNHLVLSGNRDCADFLAEIGTTDLMHWPETSDFGFVDLATDGRFTVRLNDGMFPWWILSAARRVPGTRIADHFALANLFTGRHDARIEDRIRCEGALYDRFVRPVMIAALNTEPAGASAALAAAVLRESLARGGAACRPLVATHGLGATFIDPAIDMLKRRGVEIEFGARVQSLETSDGCVRGLGFNTRRIEIAEDERVILAVSAHIAQNLLPDLTVPDRYNAILNVHFAAPPPADMPAVLGLLNATSEWIFAFDGRISVTISAANRLMDEPRETLAETVWREVSQALHLDQPMPKWQVVKERRATFDATPDQDALRPSAKTHLCNLFLAGDWTATGLPATIEGAIRSGRKAADLILA
jgi:squalene-associated FAD-dependent desaturase